MKTLIIYDSTHGNTARIANVIYNTVRAFGDASILLANKFRIQDVSDVDVIFIGTPTQGGRPTPAIQRIIKDLANRDIKNTRIAPFDTRFATNSHGLGLKMLMNTIGFAAPKITKALKKSHTGTVEQSEGFIVKDTEGPLEPSEELRASLWAKNVMGREKRATL